MFKIKTELFFFHQQLNWNGSVTSLSQSSQNFNWIFIATDSDELNAFVEKFNEKRSQLIKEINYWDRENERRHVMLWKFFGCSLRMKKKTYAKIQFAFFFFCCNLSLQKSHRNTGSMMKAKRKGEQWRTFERVRKCISFTFYINIV